MTDQLTRIERLLGKVLEKVDELESAVTTLNENLPEELREIQGLIESLSAAKNKPAWSA